MKHLLTSVLLVISLIGYSQEDKTHGLFYKISFAATLTTNEDYNFGNDEDETFINLNGVFINNTLGYQFDERSSVGLNLEYDRFLDQGLNFLPAYLNFTYNVLDFDDVLFLRGGYGRLINVNQNFEKGTMYTFGIGYRTFDEDFRNSWLIGLDFSRRRFGFRQNDKLTSVAIFLEFMLF